MNGDSKTNEILKPAEAAEFLRINREVLRRWSEKGEIPGAFKVGFQWRYHRSELVKMGQEQ